MPKLNVALSAADGRLIEKRTRIVARLSRHGPPAMLRPATPRHSSASIAHIPSVQLMDEAYAEPIGPMRRTSMNRYARATLTTTPAPARNIGVRVSPAARIAEVPMSHTVAKPFAAPMTARNGAPIATISSSAPSKRRSGAEKVTKNAPKSTPAPAPSNNDCRVASAASVARPSPMRRLTTAIVPIANERHTGNMRKRKLPAAPTPAVAVAPRCPTKAKTIAVPNALTDCSMMPGHASSRAARLGERRASSAARALGVGVSSPSTSSTCWMLTR